MDTRRISSTSFGREVAESLRAAATADGVDPPDQSVSQLSAEFLLLQVWRNALN